MYKSQVAGISFGGQMHGLVALDADDPGDSSGDSVWNDSRTGEETEFLNTVIGKDKLSAYGQHCFCRFYGTEVLMDAKA